MVTLGACGLAGWMPLGFSIVTVFLFAGPHNWLEARYMLTRMPARWGPLTGYFTTGIAGVLLLTAGMALIPWLGERFAVPSEHWPTMLATWNTALVGWVRPWFCCAAGRIRGATGPGPCRRRWC